MDRIVAFRCSVRLHSRLLRPFSDCFFTAFSEVGFGSSTFWREDRWLVLWRGRWRLGKLELLTPSDDPLDPLPLGPHPPPAVLRREVLEWPVYDLSALGLQRYQPLERP
jgi:hypothetical protein